MHDPNDARQVRLAEQRARFDRERAVDDLHAVMNTVYGRRFVHGVLGLCNLRSDGYVPGGPEAQRHQDYMAGRRSIGIELLGELERHAPLLTEQMSEEARLDEIESELAAWPTEPLEEQNDG